MCASGSLSTPSPPCVSFTCFVVVYISCVYIFVFLCLCDICVYLCVVRVFMNFWVCGVGRDNEGSLDALA